MGEQAMYIGDGVYVDIDRGMIRLSTSDGARTTNEIFLEPEVLAEFLAYLKRIGATK